MNYIVVRTAMLKRAAKVNTLLDTAKKGKKYLAKRLGLSDELIEKAPKIAPFIDLTPPRTAGEAIDHAMKKQVPNSDAVKKAPQQGLKNPKNK